LDLKRFEAKFEKLTSSLVDGLLGSSKVKSLDTTGSLYDQVRSALCGMRERVNARELKLTVREAVRGATAAAALAPVRSE